MPDVAGDAARRHPPERSAVSRMRSSVRRPGSPLAWTDPVSASEQPAEVGGVGETAASRHCLDRPVFGAGPAQLAGRGVQAEVAQRATEGRAGLGVDLVEIPDGDVVSGGDVAWAELGVADPLLDET